ncbi:unnamed protein product [Brassicogethes aeneus]|uniref:GDP-Man:Man(3)GlcNAc(2)-PP-Dol alpha-1,2-mannosyltransferase n=1 Tax=Brassicogethes aeneus TaxID=1431903 RepID=A0A9P0ASM4_BRAAE|nr:unnamed protein product [Brassicogethes aeneus]
MDRFLMLMFSFVFSMNMVWAVIYGSFTIFGVLLPVLFFHYRRKFRLEREKNSNGKTKVGIFHPYCNAGGGGEKVLWVAVQALQNKFPNSEIYIYTGDVEASASEILQNVNKNLNVKVKNTVKFVYLKKRRWVEGDMYPYFTLLGQAIGSMFLGFEGLNQVNPDICIDTTGFTFALTVFKILGHCKTGSYIHYPTITTEMLKRVQNRRALYNNRSFIARSALFTNLKLVYYHLFSWIYSLAGQCSDITMVNSTFTLEHLNLLWSKPLHLVYPPCEVDHLKKIPRSLERPDNIRILSLAQFRPEKDHQLQLQALYELREIIHEDLFSKITLVLCGSCRNTNDNERAKDLKDLSKHLSLENNVEFKINVPYKDLIDEFRKAYIGIHTMFCEHFGISIVEQMAAGLIMVAHRSGGPLLDIIETSEGSRLGFLAVTPQEFAHCLKFVLDRTDGENGEVRERAKASVDRFSLAKFQTEFLRAVDPLFKN